MRSLRNFMFKNVYLSRELEDERSKAKFILKQLISYYMDNYSKMPSLYRKIANEEGIERAVADYVAGMSDDYCLNKFNQIYVPKMVIY